MDVCSLELATLRVCGCRPHHIPFSPAGSASAWKVAQNAPLGCSGDRARGRYWVRAVPAPNAWS
eukprot:6072493-Alexandrium_andersonii.AAC.1